MASIYRKRKGGKSYGPWYLSWTRAGKRHRRSTGTEDRKIAKRLLNQLRGELALSSNELESAPITANELVDMYSQRRKAEDGCPRSIRRDSLVLRRFFEFVTVPPHRIKRQHFESYRTMRLLDVSHSTVRRDFNTIFAAFRLAHVTGVLIKNPASGIPLPKAPYRLIRYLTEEEIHQLIPAAMTWRNGKVLSIVAIGLYAGLRQAELRHLDWEDIDLDRRVLAVRAKPEEGWRPKSKQDRELPVSERLSEILSPLYGEGPLITGQTGLGRIGKSSLHRYLTPLRKLSEIPDLDWHCLRRTFASHLVMKGTSIFQVSRMLGHSSVQVTEKHYAHLAPNTLHDEVDKLDW